MSGVSDVPVSSELGYRRAVLVEVVVVRSDAFVSADARCVSGGALVGEGNLTVVGRVDEVEGCLSLIESSKMIGRIDDDDDG